MKVKTRVWMDDNGIIRMVDGPFVKTERIVEVEVNEYGLPYEELCKLVSDKMRELNIPIPKSLNERNSELRKEMEEIFCTSMPISKRIDMLYGNWYKTQVHLQRLPRLSVTEEKVVHQAFTDGWNYCAAYTHRQLPAERPCMHTDVKQIPSAETPENEVTQGICNNCGKRCYALFDKMRGMMVWAGIEYLEQDDPSLK